MLTVLLHGFTGAPASFDALRALLPGPSIAPALLGHAPSQLAPRTFADEVDRLAALVDESPDPVHLVGYSMGARLALAALARAPRRLARATLFSVHPGLATAEERAARRADDARLAALVEREGTAAFVDDWERRPLFATQAALPPSTLARQRAIRLAHDPRGLALALRRLGLAEMADLRPALADVRAPVVVVAGGLDDRFLAVARSLVPLSPLVRAVAASGCGHNPILERPALAARLVIEEVP